MSERTCRKWRDRYLAEGGAGLLDRSSAPGSIPHRTPEELVQLIVMLRRLRMTGTEIALSAIVKHAVSSARSSSAMTRARPAPSAPFERTRAGRRGYPLAG